MANSGEQVNTCGNLNSHLQQAHNEAALPNLKSSSKAKKGKLCKLYQVGRQIQFQHRSIYQRHSNPCLTHTLLSRRQIRPLHLHPSQEGRRFPTNKVRRARTNRAYGTAHASPPDSQTPHAGRHAEIPLTRNRRQIGTRRGRKRGCAGTARITPLEGEEGGRGGGRH